MCAPPGCAPHAAHDVAGLVTDFSGHQDGRSRSHFTRVSQLTPHQRVCREGARCRSRPHQATRLAWRPASGALPPRRPRPTPAQHAICALRACRRARTTGSKRKSACAVRAERCGASGRIHGRRPAGTRQAPRAAQLHTAFCMLALSAPASRAHDPGKTSCQ